jgi:hypothetical protein
MAANVPVVIEEEAARRAARLRIERELRRMIAWALDNVPDLRGIRVAASGTLPSSAAEVVIRAYAAGPARGSAPESPDHHFLAWRLRAFAPEVGRKVSMWTSHLPMPPTPASAGRAGETVSR